MHLEYIRLNKRQSNELNATLYINANFIDSKRLTAYIGRHCGRSWLTVESQTMLSLSCGCSTKTSAPEPSVEQSLQTASRSRRAWIRDVFSNPSLCIGWLMKKTMRMPSRRLQWTFLESLEDQDFANVISLLVKHHQDIQGKANDLDSLGKQIGLQINRKKTKILKINPKKWPANQDWRYQHRPSWGLPIPRQQDLCTWQLGVRC